MGRDRRKLISAPPPQETAINEQRGEMREGSQRGVDQGRASGGPLPKLHFCPANQDSSSRRVQRPNQVRKMITLYYNCCQARARVLLRELAWDEKAQQNTDSSSLSEKPPFSSFPTIHFRCYFGMPWVAAAATNLFPNQGRGIWLTFPYEWTGRGEAAAAASVVSPLRRLSDERLLLGNGRRWWWWGCLTGMPIAKKRSGGRRKGNM